MPLRRPDSWPVVEVAEAIGARPPDDATRRALDVWLDALALWNAKIDLTAAKEPRALVWLMLADAMMLAGAVPSGEVIDVGTGAGAPGLALAILRPDLRVTLYEPLGKRASFLRSVIGTLGRTDVILRAERVEAAHRGAFDVAVSRATFPPPEWLAVGADLVRPGGSVWVLLAQDESPADVRCALAETLAYVDASSGAKKRLVRYVREGGAA